MSEQLYMQAVQLFGARAKKRFNVPLDEKDDHNLEMLGSAVYFIDNYIDDNHTARSREEKARDVVEAIRTGDMGSFKSDPKLTVSLQNLRGILVSKTPAQQKDLLDLLNKILEAGNTLRTTADIKTFLKTRREEALHVGDVCSIIIAEKIAQTKDPLTCWRSLRNFMVTGNFVDTLADAGKDWKSGELNINPHILRLHLLFSQYPGRPPYLHHFIKYGVPALLRRGCDR